MCPSFSFLQLMTSSESSLNGESPSTMTGFSISDASRAMLEFMVSSFLMRLKKTAGDFERSRVEVKQVCAPG